MKFFKAAAKALRRGLGRTAGAFGGGLKSMLIGRKLDEALIDEIEMRLIAADVGVSAASEIIDGLRKAVRAGELEKGEDALVFLKRSLKARLATSKPELNVASESPTVVLVVGVNGVGKTTSIAKVGHTFSSQGSHVMVAAADTFRAGAVEQLATWAKRIGVDIVRGSDGADPAAVVFDAMDAAIARKVDVLLVDTAGRLHVDQPLMRQLKKMREVIERKLPGAPHEVLLVLDATSGQNALQQAKVFNEEIGLTGIFLAKLDGTARGGIAVAIHDAFDVPVKLIGVGETPEDVQPFDADAFIEAMFEGNSEKAATAS